MTSICTSNSTAAFIDLATYDEIEKYLYGGKFATSYFVRETKKSTWFSQIPVPLQVVSGCADFGSTFAVSISRSADYLLNCWLRLQLPQLSSANQDITIMPTHNFMHNLVQECCITFNDLVAQSFTSRFLDFWTAFTVPASKTNTYNNMINYAVGAPGLGALSSTTLNLPLPFFFSRDSGVALPTAALPYNEMLISITLRPLEELYLLYDTSSDECLEFDKTLVTSQRDNYSIRNLTVWGNYAVVSNDERKRMACGPRDILIEQVQQHGPRSFNSVSQSDSRKFDLKFSHAVKVLFFSLMNTSCKGDLSNYMTGSFQQQHTQEAFACVDPIAATSLLYENTTRLANMGSDYYTLVQPYYHAPSGPPDNVFAGSSGCPLQRGTGYHMYSYSLDFECLDPMGSTNYGKLTNVSLSIQPSGALVSSVTGSSSNTYEFYCLAVNNNIIRVAGGALGFPVL
jgi:hypothetical protein